MRASSLLFSLFLLLFSCAGPPKIQEPRKARVIENVPFYAQEAYQCGPASLAGVLNFWGLKDSPADIAAEIFSKKARGTLDMDMVFYAERKGLRSSQYSGSMEDLGKNIDSGYPLIVLVDEGFWVYQKNHFMVVLGYGERGLIANSGKEQYKLIPEDLFLRTWEKAKFWTLRITPQ